MTQVHTFRRLVALALAAAAIALAFGMSAGHHSPTRVGADGTVTADDRFGGHTGSF